MSVIFSLVDCNNFYASCERIFNPSLDNKPIVVLSNNDGCIIARSNEAKSLGIAMGAPYHENESLIKKNTKLIYIESPGSLNFEVTDLKNICNVAKKII